MLFSLKYKRETACLSSKNFKGTKFVMKGNIFLFIYLRILIDFGVFISCLPWNVPDQPDVIENRYGVLMPEIRDDDLNKAGKNGIKSFQDLKYLEEELWNKGMVVKKGSKEAAHQALFGNNAEVQQLGKDGLINVEASLHLMKKFHLNEIQARDGLPQFSIKDTVINSSCPNGNIFCKNTYYRSMDGSCNNLKNRLWGKSFTAFERLLPPDYADGLNKPRVAKDGSQLPSARLVSSLVSPDYNVPHGYLTTFFVYWGQFLDHDLTLTALTRGNNGKRIECCGRGSRRHPACFPIHIPENDTFYSNFGETCMEFVRSFATARPKCNFGPREQMNQLTAFIDGSNIYGSTKEIADELRSFNGGKLKINYQNGEVMLPKVTKRNEQCERKQTERYCFMSGDIRVNENTNLAIMHTIWLREHNRIAGRLQEINPDWDDERLYQESRRIVGAQIQHITYKEFLPLLLGHTVINTFNLKLKSKGYSYEYNPSINPSILNSFATAAYRFGHTLIQGLIDLKKDKIVAQQFSLSDNLFNPALLYKKNYLEMLLKGMVDQPSQTYDSFVSSKLTNHLFERPGEKFGLDLISLNIQRGRDHGLPSYNKWRKICKLSPVRSFSKLEEIVGKQTARIFSRLYKSVDDIDLFAAGISELPLSDGVVGPTFACIIAEQFRRLKYGDRFWYENGKQETSFTLEQLEEIKKSNLARILCDNMENLHYIQKDVLIRHANWNPKISCSDEDIPHVYLDPWYDDYSKWK